ncbi:hypothetical protein, partial [Pseudorhodobacter ferrugineus]|uniref:hypothetical protein n=1 Tax=Pseudorhodobacter ferrugineus TaxID=77008 RepID=UPI00048A670F
LVCEFSSGHIVLLASKITKQGVYKSRGYSGTGLTIDLHGALASLLMLATGAPTHQVARMASGAQNAKSSAVAALQGVDSNSKLVLVAGARFQKYLPLHTASEVVHFQSVNN